MGGGRGPQGRERDRSVVRRDERAGTVGRLKVCFGAGIQVVGILHLSSRLYTSMHSTCDVPYRRDPQEHIESMTDVMS